MARTHSRSFQPSIGLRSLAGAALLSAGAQLCVMAQMTIVGRISGTVMDTSHSVIVGASVTVTDEATGLSRSVSTDASGFYVVTNLPVGSYRVAAEQKGFGKEVKAGYRLDADGRLTVDFILKPGEVSETVEVTATGESVNTTSGEIARVVDMEQVQDLALNGRNYIQLVSLVPGVALIDEDQMAVTTSLSAGNQSVNGVRTDQNHLTVDGGFDLDSGSNGSQINNVGVDFIQEVSIKTSNFSAEYGRNAGGAINAVTRRGGDRFHGGAFEFLRNDKLDAANYFSPVDPNGQRQKQKLRFNDFGWDLGGPIKKEKLFFFAGEEWKRIRQNMAPTRPTLPTTAELRGDFSGSPGPLNMPGTSTPIPGRNIASMMTPDGRAIAALYTAMQKLAASFTDTPTGNNAVFQLSSPLDWREDIIRADYRINEKQSIYLRYLHDNYNIVLPFGFSCASSTNGVPSCPENRLRPGTSYQLSHTWLVTPTLVNEANINASWNGQRIPPVGTLWQRGAYGFTFPQIFGATGGGRFRDSIPDITINGSGSGANQVRGIGAVKGQSHSLLSPTTDIAEGDNLTWTHANHTVKSGVVIIRNRKDQNSRSAYAGTITFSASNNTMNSTGNALADALLGNFQSYQEASDDPIGHFRFTQFHVFLTDSWKVLRNLSLEFGVRYQYAVPTYTDANNLANFDPSRYDPAQAVTVRSNGTIDTSKGGNPLNGIIRASSGVPADQLARVPNGNDPSVLAVPAGAPPGLYNRQSAFAPRFGFAWAPYDHRTSIRGGFGIFYDTPEGNMVFDELSNPPFTQVAEFQNGNLANPSGGTAAAAAPFSISAINPQLKQAYTMSFSLSVQHELPRGLFVELAYVGNQSRHLLHKPDINQPSLSVLLANAALPMSQRANTNLLRPFKGYSSIGMFLSDATSNYNALQAYIAKRKGNLTFTGSYTWSKALTDAGGGNDDVRDSGNNDNIQDAVARYLNYGPAPFDRRHVLVTSYSYHSPFFRGQPGVIGKLLGGWELSGITRVQTGQPFTVTGSVGGSALGRRRADYRGGPINVSNPTADNWFNGAAFSPAPDTRLGTAGPGMVRGPSLYLWDLSFRKQIVLPHEGWRLRFQTDFFNAFNHPNFRFESITALVTNNTNISDGTYGKVSNAGPARNIQFGLKLTF